MRFNTLKLSKMLNITLNCYKKTILLLILTLLLVTFHLPFLKQQCQEIPFKKPSSQAQWGVIHSNDSVRARLENKCNMFRGTWVPYTKGPYYTNESRCVIRDGQNCMKFGRPDTEFMKWRWKPDECELPLFDATRFLKLLRGKSMAFVGDSVARNQMESLGCLLSHVTDFVDESNTKDSRYRHWFYTDYNFTLTFLWTTHLVKTHGADTSSINSIDLYLDEVDDAWATRVEDYDCLIISSGNWFYKQLTYYEKHEVVGCSQCMEKNMTDLTMYYGYRRAFQTAFRTLLDLQNFKGTVFLRTISPAHFEAEERGGRGSCVRTRLFTRQELKFDWYVWLLRMIQLEQFWAAKREGKGRGGLQFRLMDVTEAMRLRPDGHPNHYGHLPKKKQWLADCIHWCLPGPIDMWNELLLQILNTDEGESEGEGLKR